MKNSKKIKRAINPYEKIDKKKPSIQKESRTQKETYEVCTRTSGSDSKQARDMVRKKFYPKYDEMGREGKAKINQVVSLKHEIK